MDPFYCLIEKVFNKIPSMHWLQERNSIVILLSVFD